MKKTDVRVGLIAAYHYKRLGSVDRKAVDTVVEVIETGVTHRYEVTTGGWDFRREWREIDDGVRVRVVDAPENARYLEVGEEFVTRPALLDDRADEIEKARAQIAQKNERRAASDAHDALVANVAQAWGWELTHAVKVGLTTLTDEQLDQMIIHAPGTHQTVQ